MDLLTFKHKIEIHQEPLNYALHIQHCGHPMQRQERVRKKHWVGSLKIWALCFGYQDFCGFFTKPSWQHSRSSNKSRRTQKTTFSQNPNTQLTCRVAKCRVNQSVAGDRRLNQLLCSHKPSPPSHRRPRTYKPFFQSDPTQKLLVQSILRISCLREQA